MSHDALAAGRGCSQTLTKFDQDKARAIESEIAQLIDVKLLLLLRLLLDARLTLHEGLGQHAGQTWSQRSTGRQGRISPR